MMSQGTDSRKKRQLDASPGWYKFDFAFVGHWPKVVEDFRRVVPKALAMKCRRLRRMFHHKEIENSLALGGVESGYFSKIS